MEIVGEKVFDPSLALECPAAHVADGGGKQRRPVIFPVLCEWINTEVRSPLLKLVGWHGFDFANRLAEFLC